MRPSNKKQHFYRIEMPLSLLIMLTMMTAMKYIKSCGLRSCNKGKRHGYLFKRISVFVIREYKYATHYEHYR